MLQKERVSYLKIKIDLLIVRPQKFTLTLTKQRVEMLKVPIEPQHLLMALFNVL